MKKIIIALLLVGLYIACSDDDSTPQLQKPEVSFSTFVDERDGNEYKCITIGDQTWMAENLRYRVPGGSFSGCFTYGEKTVSSSNIVINQGLWEDSLFMAVEDGRITDTPTFPYATMYVEWYATYWNAKEFIQRMTTTANSGEFVAIITEIYDNCILPTIALEDEDKLVVAEIDNGGYYEKHGFLYTFESAQKAIPEGWRLPTDEDWKKLEETLGISVSELDLLDEWRGKFEGELLKDGDDGIGFDVAYGGTKAAGIFLYGSPFMNKGSKAYYWSSTQYVMQDSIDMGIIRVLSRFDSQILRGSTKPEASYNIRCIKK